MKNMREGFQLRWKRALVENGKRHVQKSREACDYKSRQVQQMQPHLDKQISATKQERQAMLKRRQDHDQETEYLLTALAAASVAAAAT